MLIGKINASIWFRCLQKKKKSLMKDKTNKEGAEAPHSSEPQKAHPTGEFVVVEYNGGHSLLRLGSRLATEVSE